LELVASQSPEHALQLLKRAEPYRAKFTPLDGARFDLQVARLNRKPVADLTKQVKDLLALAPGDVTAVLMLAQLSAADHKMPEAISHLNEAIAIDPSSVQARQMLAGAYLNTHQDELARKAVADLRALRPDDVNVLRMEAEVEFATVHLPEAERAYKGLNDVSGAMGAAVCRLLESDPTGAQAQFERAATLRANDPLLPFGRATWLALSGDRTKAIQLLTSAKMPNTDFQSVALSQAAVYQTLNKNAPVAQQLAAASLQAAKGDIPKSFALVSSLVAARLCTPLV
jgi:predicted Zn-dependent protease